MVLLDKRLGSNTALLSWKLGRRLRQRRKVFLCLRMNLGLCGMGDQPLNWPSQYGTWRSTEFPLNFQTDSRVVLMCSISKRSHEPCRDGQAASHPTLKHGCVRTFWTRGTSRTNDFIGKHREEPCAWIVRVEPVSSQPFQIVPSYIHVQRI